MSKYSKTEFNKICLETERIYFETGSYVSAAKILGIKPQAVSLRVKRSKEMRDLVRTQPFVKADPMSYAPVINDRLDAIDWETVQKEIDDANRAADNKAELVGLYIDFLIVNRRVPNLSDLEIFSEGKINKYVVKSEFGGMNGMHDFVEENYASKLAEHTLTERVLFSQKRMERLEDETSKHNRFVITTAVSEKEVYKPFYKALKSYCDKHDAILIITMCQDVASRSRKHQWSLDPILANEHVVVSDVKLNDNFFISSIKLSAKHINPLTGLNRIGQRNGSFVYASPKQFLTYVATSPSHSKIPHALMTPGAITLPNYESDLYMSHRTSKIAEEDHVMGAVIVEVENDRIFHFRQIQANPEDGSFADMCIRYHEDGSTEKVEATFVLGDYHSGATDEGVKKSVGEICQNLPIKDIVLHDFFDGFCINHHDRDKPGISGWKAMNGWISIKDELDIGASEINWLHSLVPGKLIMVKSNHDEILERYLVEGAYVKDRVNYYFSLDLAKKALDGEDVLKYAYTNHTDIKEPDRIIWLSRDEEYKVAGVELGAHGDLGANGSRGSLGSIENAYGNCIVGHTHSAAIYRGVFRVGTSSRKDLHYNRGPSSWTHTSCLLYDDGSRQLINFIDGEYLA